MELPAYSGISIGVSKLQPTLDTMVTYHIIHHIIMYIFFHKPDY